MSMSADPLPQSPAGAAGLRLLRTKLFLPRAHPDLVPRGRLLRRLDEGRSCALTLLVAPAGSGKTTLLAEWAAQGASIGWVSLDAADNDPVRFWGYVVAALRDVLGPGLGEEMLALLGGPQPPPLDALLVGLVNELSTKAAATILILDDYHVINNPGIHHGLDFLLGNLPDSLRLVIASRDEPPLALARLRTRRQLLDLSAADLRFTPEETAAFLNRVMGLGLTGDQVATLEARTEGWAAGLQLAALSMQSARSPRDLSRFVRAFGGGQRYVFDYLAQEVLAQQRADVRVFLLQTSVLERFTGDLCDAILKDEGERTVERPLGMKEAPSSLLLDHLERANLFLVPLDPDRRWYRFHHLFAEFLRAQLAREYRPEQIASLHGRAWRWYEAHNLLEEALPHALAAGEHDEAARLLGAVEQELVDRGALLTLANLLRALPTEIRAARPRLNMCYAWMLLATGQMAEAETALKAVEAAVGAPADTLVRLEAQALAPLVRYALVEVTAVRANLAFHRFDIDTARTLAERALANLDTSGGVYLFHPPEVLRVPVYFTLAIAQEFSGESGLASTTFQEAVRLAHAAGNDYVESLALTHLGQLQALAAQLNDAAATYRAAVAASIRQTGRPSPLSGSAHAWLGWILYEWNDLKGAAAEFQAAIDLGRPWHNWEALGLGYLGRAQVQQALGHAVEAEAALGELETFARKYDFTIILPWVEAAQARYRAESGRLAEAGAWAAGCDLSTEGEIPYQREGEALALARVWLALGRGAEAGRLLGALLAQAEAGGRPGRAVELLTLSALAAQSTGDAASAEAHLRRALVLAEPSGYVRTFLDSGEPLRRLLAMVAGAPRPAGAAAGEAQPSAPYLSRLLALFSRTAETAAGANRPVSTGVDTPVLDPQTPAAGAPRPGSGSPPASSPPEETLSPRELEVLSLLGDGLSNAEIAGRLVVSLNTVKTHLKTIYGKLGVSTRTQALARARQAGLL